MESVLKLIIENRLSLKRNEDKDQTEQEILTLETKIDFTTKQMIDLFTIQKDDCGLFMCFLNYFDNLLIDCQPSYRTKRDRACLILNELCRYACILAPWNCQDELYDFKSEAYNKVEKTINEILKNYF